MKVVQGTLDELGTPLSEVTFVVVDLETTGGSAAKCGITEIGAVKTRGGERIGEFQTLVNPGEPIPAFISVLTGITDAMVAEAPRIDTVLPAFLEFARGAVLVAHNAPFDIGFLKSAAARCGIEWPGPRILDTVQLARQLVGKDETRDHKLSSLAPLFGAEQTPDHRALHDARATVDVLHGLIGRVGNLGVHTLEEFATFTSRVDPAQRRKRHLAEALPHEPGVYLFQDRDGRVLYVGTSRDLRTRVRTYFTAAERRSRMAEMVRLAEKVTPIVCATVLEAQVRELRLIAEHEPPYNRRSRRPGSRPWIKLTVEPYPRLSVVRDRRADGAAYAGPFSGADAARAALDAVHEVTPLRRCTTRLSTRTPTPACALAEMGRCGAPCDHRQSREEYEEVCVDVRGFLHGRTRRVAEALQSRMRTLAEQERYEDAAQVRDRLTQLVKACARAQRLEALAVLPQMVAARRRPSGGWEIVCVRYGRLAGTTASPPGAHPSPYIDALVAMAEAVPAPDVPAGAALVEETEMVLRWLEEEGTRLVEVEGDWCLPVHGAGAVVDRLRPDASDVVGFDPEPGTLT